MGAIDMHSGFRSGDYRADPTAQSALPASRTVTATKRFSDDYEEFCQKYNLVAPTLRAFIAFRMTARQDQQFSQKDSRMQNIPNMSRCHLVQGKALLMYRQQDNQIQLLAITEHDGIETRNNGWLRDFAKNDDLQPWTQPEIQVRSSFPAVSRKTPMRRTELPKFDLTKYVPGPVYGEKKRIAKFVTDDDLVRTGSSVTLAGNELEQDTPKPEVCITEFVSERAAWGHCVVRMRLADQPWDVIHRVMRQRLRDDPQFRSDMIETYAKASIAERSYLRARLRTTPARRAAEAAAEAEERARSWDEALAKARSLTAEPPAMVEKPPVVVDLAASRLAQERREAGLKLAKAQARIDELVVALEAERAATAEARGLAEGTQQAQAMVAEARAAKNLALMARDQADEALAAEKEISRRNLALMRAAEANVHTERTVKLSAQRALAEAQTVIAGLRNAVAAGGPDPEMTQLVAERAALQESLREALDAHAAAESELAAVRHEIEDLRVKLTAVPAQPAPVVEADGLGTRVRRLRVARNMSPEQLATRIGLSPVVIGHYECDRSKPRRETLGKIAEVFHVSEHYLLHGVNATPVLSDLDASLPDAEALSRLPTTGERIAFLRARAGLTLAAAGQKCSVTLSTVHSWEQNATVPSGQRLERLAAMFDVPAEVIVPASVVPVASKPGKAVNWWQKGTGRELPDIHATAGHAD